MTRLSGISKLDKNSIYLFVFVNGFTTLDVLFALIEKNNLTVFKYFYHKCVPLGFVFGPIIKNKETVTTNTTK